jgi:hypothetical protein
MLLSLLINSYLQSIKGIIIFFSPFLHFLRPPLWSSGQSFWLQIQRSWVRFTALPGFLKSGGSGNGVHSALRGQLRSYLEGKVAAPV